MTVPSYGLPTVTIPDLREEAEQMLDRAVERWAAKYPDVQVTTTAAQGTLTHQVIDASKGANLLVVGSRGHGAFAGMLLGSVSQAAVRHAHCPVAIAH